MSDMVLAIATRGWEQWQECIQTWRDNAIGNYPECVVVNRDVLDAYQTIVDNTTAPILAFLHDDLKLLEKGWDQRVLREFADPNVGMVCLGGGRRHGHPDIYRVPYELPQLGRFGFLSNMRNAQEHGERFTGECDIAVADGFALFIRRSILEKAGGWPHGGAIAYQCYDYWASCIVRRQGYKLRLVGIACDHISGRTATMVHLPDTHAAAHAEIYEMFRDVLPFSV